MAALAFTTQTAVAGAALSWMLWEWFRHGKPTSLGFASGIIAGLVAITPAAGFVTPGSALLIGLTSGIICNIAVESKSRFGYDDSLDAFGVHGVGGLLGAPWSACCASNWWRALSQLGLQATGAAAGIGIAVIGTLVIGFLVSRIVPSAPATRRNGTASTSPTTASGPITPPSATEARP